MSARVLVVDDSKFMRMLLSEVLTSGGYEVVEAESGEEALAVYQEEAPDLVTLDILMPGKDGIQTVEALREFDPGARIVMVTALGQDSHVRRALEAGADGFILKPFSTERVLSTVRMILQI